MMFKKKGECGMVQAIKRQFQVQWKDWAWLNVVIFGCGIVGCVLFYIIANTGDERITDWFAMGTVLAGLFSIIFLMVLSVVQMPLHFNIQIAMGSTRKQFMVSWLAVGVAEAVVAVLLVMGICFCENKVCAVLYAGLPNEINFLPYLLKYGVLVAAAAMILGTFAGALIMRFGRVAFWILWALWMFICLGLPGMEEAALSVPDSFYGKIGTVLMQFVRGISANTWVALAVAGSLAALAGIYGILHKQAVAG